MDLILRQPKPFGCVAAIPSKSHVHRLLICAALSDGPTRIFCPSANADIDATVRCLSALGAEIVRDADGFTVSPIREAPTKAALDCGESGSTLRFLLPVAAALGVEASFYRSGRLRERPLSPLAECLTEHGAHLSPQTEEPLVLTGRIAGGDYAIDGGVSSQFVTGLLFALSLGLRGQTSRLAVTGKTESRPYIDLTVSSLRAFGVELTERRGVFTIPSGSKRPHSPGIVTAEGDWSNAAFWLAFGALGNPVGVTGLDPASAQGDRAIVPLLERFGARCTVGGGAVSVSPGRLRGVRIDAADIPDLVPPLAVVASVAEGVTVIENCGRLRLKESDRMASVRDLLNGLGADAECENDSIIIKGRKRLEGGTAASFGDHRIAMAAALASSVCEGSVTITGCECVSKSYPGFFDDLARLCGKEKE